MSTLQVELCQILEVKPHPNADKLDLIRVKGWDTIVKRDQFKVDDSVIFIPPDAIVPAAVHQGLKITNYCAELPKSSQDAIDGKRRVKAARLRGVPSYGTVMSLDELYLILGEKPSYSISNTDFAHLLGITKYEPPIKSTQGDVERDSPQFHRYTDIENWRNYPDVFKDGEQVVITEKIHGTNCRLGYCLDTKDETWKFMAGSHRTRRKEGLYWEPFEWYPVLKEMITYLHEQNDNKPVVIFGEIFGAGVQDMNYGLAKKDFRIFDIAINGTYLDFSIAEACCRFYDIPFVPILYIGGYSEEIINQFTDGQAFQTDENTKFKGREGCVIKSYIEDEDTLIGRKILKSISCDYLDRRGAQDNY
jgi:RNA ligase (TIGR02306 family)